MPHNLLGRIAIRILSSEYAAFLTLLVTVTALVTLAAGMSALGDS